MSDTERYDRQVRLFGADGQRSVASSSVGIVGLGGLGSHVAQQLAHLGVLSYTLIDSDHVSISNLNRLVGATSADAANTIAKVEVAERQIQSIQASASVQRVRDLESAPSARAALRSSTIVFGCVDNDEARLGLTDLCARTNKPYVDISTEIATDGSWYGGRLVWTSHGTGCLVCRGELDQHALAQAQMTDAQRAADDRIYGVARGDLGGTGPAVISINGVVASLAVTEFIAWATGLRAPIPFLTYRGDLGTVTRRVDPPRPGCYYCEVLRKHSS